MSRDQQREDIEQAEAERTKNAEKRSDHGQPLNDLSDICEALNRGEISGERAVARAYAIGLSDMRPALEREIKRRQELEKQLPTKTFEEMLADEVYNGSTGAEE